MNGLPHDKERRHGGPADGGPDCTGATKVAHVADKRITPLKIIAASTTQAGTRDDHNEDYVVVDPELSLYIVCDGVGGHAAGEVAAEAAAEAVRRYIGQQRALIQAFDESASSRDSLLRLIDDAVQYACREVFRIATSDAGRAGMGTMMTVVLTVGDFGVMGHVGDSRLYLRRAGRTEQLSEDHTYASEAIRRGLMTPEEAAAGPYAHVITRAVGVQSSVRVDTLLFDIVPGDTLLLCTGGIHRRSDDDAGIGAMLELEDAEQIPERLREKARAEGSRGDASAIVLRAVSVECDADRDHGRACQVNLRIDTIRHVVFFRHLDMREICKVLNASRCEEREADQFVIREGERSDALYAILHGTLRVERGEQLVRTMTAGDHFGEMALFNHRARSASVKTQTQCGLLVIDCVRFNELLRTEPVLSVKLLWCFAQVLSLRLDDVTGSLYDDDDSAASIAEELKVTPFTLGAQPPNRFAS